MAINMAQENYRKVVELTAQVAEKERLLGLADTAIADQEAALDKYHAKIAELEAVVKEYEQLYNADTL